MAVGARYWAGRYREGKEATVGNFSADEIKIDDKFKRSEKTKFVKEKASKTGSEACSTRQVPRTTAARLEKNIGDEIMGRHIGSVTVQARAGGRVVK